MRLRHQNFCGATHEDLRWAPDGHPHHQSHREEHDSNPQIAARSFDALDRSSKVKRPKVVCALAHFLVPRELAGSLFHFAVVVLHRSPHVRLFAWPRRLPPVRAQAVDLLTTDIVFGSTPTSTFSA